MCIASAKNITMAMRIRDALVRGGISAEIVSVDPSLTRRGCAYGVSFPCEYEWQVKRILGARKIEYGDIIGGRR